MSEALNEFLVDLASSPDRMQQFLAHPFDVTSAAGLTEQEAAAVLARDGRRLRRTMGGLRLESNNTAQFHPHGGKKKGSRKKSRPGKAKPGGRKKPAGSKK